VLLQQTEQRLDQHGLVHSRDYKVRSPAVASCLTTELAGRIGRAVVLRETCSTPSKPSSGRDRGRLNHRTHMRESGKIIYVQLVGALVTVPT